MNVSELYCGGYREGQQTMVSLHGISIQCAELNISARYYGVGMGKMKKKGGVLLCERVGGGWK